jgi:hypothetical protein
MKIFGTLLHLANRPQTVMQMEHLAFCQVRTPAILRLDYRHITGVGEVAAYVRRFILYEVILQQFVRNQCEISVNQVTTVFWDITSCTTSETYDVSEEPLPPPTSGSNSIYCWNYSFKFFEWTEHGCASEPMGETWGQKEVGLKPPEKRISALRRKRGD